MCGSSRSRTTTNQTTNQTATTTPQAPSWLQNPTQDYIGRVNDLMNRGGPFVAGASDLQRQAFDGASRLGGGPTINLPGGRGGGMGGGPKIDEMGPQVAGGGGDGYVSPNAGSGGQGGGMGGGRTANVFDLAGLLGLSGGTAGPNLTNGTALSRFTGYDPADQAGTQGYQGQGYTASGPAGTQGYDVAGRTGGQGYTASGPFVPQGYDPAQGTATGYTASGPAGGQGYTASLGQGRGYQASLVDPMAFGVGAVNVGPAAQASSRNFTDVDLQGYLNPYTSEVQDAFTTDFDTNAGRVRARQAAIQAANGGLRNSNNALLSAETEGELARARGAGIAGIRSQGFDTAAGLATGDLNREASTSQFNAGQSNQRTLAQAQIDAQRASQEASLRGNALLANQGALNRAGEFGATADNTFGLANMDALNRASEFGADARNRSALDFAGRTDAAGQFTAGQQNDMTRFNTGALNDARSLLSQQQLTAGLDLAGRQDQAGQFGADAANRADLDFAARRDAAGQFGADAFNRSALDFAGRSDAAGQFGANALNRSNEFGADAFNRAALDFAGRRDAAGQFGADAFNRNSQFNAGSINQNNQFNAGQMDNALARRLQAAGLLTNLGATMGADTRANIGLQAELGGQQRDITQRQMTDEYQRLALIQSLLGTNPNAFIGQTSTGTSTTNGTSTQSSNPGLGGIIGGIGQGLSGAASLAALFSDERLKADIEPAGTDAKGRRWYDYRYIWDAVGTRRRGVMAQEVMATDPHAVGERDGFLTVDYSKLEMA